jgi:hypothetical protein
VYVLVQMQVEDVAVLCCRLKHIDKLEDEYMDNVWLQMQPETCVGLAHLVAVPAHHSFSSNFVDLFVSSLSEKSNTKHNP